MSELHVEVCKVDNVQKHPNADRLSIVTVKGWNCITALDQFKQDQIVVYIPPDSIIPASLIDDYHLYSEQEQEDGTKVKKTYFKTTYEDGSARVSNQRLRGLLSQGLLLNLTDDEIKKWPIGTDVAEAFGITKWEPKAASYNETIQAISKKKLNPLFDKYTDIENIKNFNVVFEEGDEVVITEKVHGTNSRYGKLKIYNGKNVSFFKKIYNWVMMKMGKTHEYVYGSHNVQLGCFSDYDNFYGDNVYAKISKKYKFNEIIPDDYILYGEIYGKGIQDLEYGLDDIQFLAFDVKYNNEYLDYDKFVEFCTERSIPMVPLLYKGKFNNDLIDKYTNGNSTICKNQIREGCVVKSAKEANNIYVGRKVLKSISEKYLLRKNATEYH